VKLILQYLFEYIDKLLSVDGIVYLFYKEVFAAYCKHHSYNKNYYIDSELDADELPNNNDNSDNIKVEPDPKVEAPLEDFEAYTQHWLNHDSVQLDRLNSLGTCYLN
jgi:antirestriction protein